MKWFLSVQLGVLGLVGVREYIVFLGVERGKIFTESAGEVGLEYAGAEHVSGRGVSAYESWYAGERLFPLKGV